MIVCVDLIWTVLLWSVFCYWVNDNAVRGETVVVYKEE